MREEERRIGRYPRSFTLLFESTPNGWVDIISSLVFKGWSTMLGMTKGESNIRGRNKVEHTF